MTPPASVIGKIIWVNVATGSQVEATGNLNLFTSNASSNNAPITVPADANILIMGITGYNSSISNYFNSTSGFAANVSGNNMTHITDSGLSSTMQSGLYYLLNPPTGAQNISYSLNNVPTYGVHLWSRCFKGCNMTDPIKSSASNAAAGSNNVSLPTLSGNNNDLFFGVGVNWPISANNLSWTGATELNENDALQETSGAGQQSLTGNANVSLQSNSTIENITLSGVVVRAL